MAYNIRQEEVEALYNFSLLDLSIKKQVYEQIADLRIVETPKKAAQKIADKLNISPEEILPALRVCFGLKRTQYNRKNSSDDLVSAFKNALLNDFDFDGGDFSEILNVVSAFLEISNDIPVVTTLAIDTITQNANNYLSTSIVDELRPVFFDSKIYGLAYYHTINLHFQSEDGSHHNFFTTIDSSDIDDLIEQLQAAKERIILVNDKYGDGIIQL